MRHVSRLALSLASLSLVLACRTATDPGGSPMPTPLPASRPVAPPPAPEPTPAPAPAPTPAPPLPSRPLHPEGAIAPTCLVRAEVEPTIAGDQVRLQYRLVNTRPEQVEVTLTSPCPAGPVTFDGLPPGADPLHTCRMGACVAPTTTMTYQIAPNSSAPLGETVLRARGDACNPPLPFGSTLVRLRVTAQASDLICDGATLHLVRDASTGALRRAALDEPRIPPTTTRPSRPAAPRPSTTTPARPDPQRRCPACGIGCPNGVPKTGLGPDGCPVCGCEDLRPTLER